LNQEKTVLKKGDEAPRFELRDQDNNGWRLEDLLGEKVVLYFYPADDTPGCTKESCDFRDSYADWQKAGYRVLGISPQNTQSKKAFADKYSLPFPLLADEDTNVAKAYDTVREKPGEWAGIPLHVRRSTFVIDENGIIEQALYNVKAPGHVQSLRDSLQV
jgi:peroxiredoxin Q/BCP